MLGHSLGSFHRGGGYIYHRDRHCTYVLQLELHSADKLTLAVEYSEYQQLFVQLL